MRSRRLFRSVFLVAVTIFLLGGCSKDEPVGPADPSQNTTATVTIGPQGGILESSAFTLRVPAGAFSSPVPLTVSTVPPGHPFGNHAISTSFRVGGLPEEFVVPLVVSITPTDTRSGKSFIAAGRETILPGTDSTTILFRLLGAVDSAGRLTSILPARTKTPGGIPRALGKTGSNPIDYFLGITRYDTVNVSYVEVVFPDELDRDLMVRTGAAIGYAHVTINTMHLPNHDYSLLLPLRAQVVGQMEGASTVARYCPGGEQMYRTEDFTPTSVVLLNYDKMIPADFPAIAHHVAREVFLFVPEHIQMDGGGYGRWFDNTNYWFHVAIGSWFEEKQGGVPLPAPVEFPGNEMRALKGIGAGLMGPERVARSHGFGFSPVVKYLVTNYREDVISRIYDRWEKGTKPVEALLNSVADPPRFWWPDFLKAYLGGSIYGVSPYTFLENVQGTATISSAKDTLFIFEPSCPDLSARLYLVNLNFPEIAPVASLKFSTETSAENRDDISVMLFGFSGGKLEYWSQAQSVTVTKIRDLTAAGIKILAVVVNTSCEEPHDAFKDVALKIQVPASPTFSRASINLKTSATYEYYDGSLTNGLFLYFERKFREGSYAEGEFTATWDEGAPSASGKLTTSAGSLSAKVDFSTGVPVLTSFALTETRSKLLGAFPSYTPGSETWTIVSKNPITVTGAKTAWGSYEFRRSGSIVGDMMASINHRLVEGSYSIELKHFSGDSNSALEITLE